MNVTRRTTLTTMAGAAAVATLRFPARSADLPVIRVGKAAATAFPFITLEVGQQIGTWQSAGFTVEASALRGDGQVQQALAAGNIDLGLGSGPGLGFIAKGVPAHGVAAFYGAPDDIVVMVSTKAGIKTVADLKGKRLACTTPGSLTDWLIKQLALSQNWGPNGIVSVPLGETKAMTAALERSEIDGMVAAIEVGAQLQSQGEVNVLLSGGQIVHDFITHIIYSRDDYTKSNPELVKKFIDAWFKTVAWMRAHRDETIAIGAKAEGLDPKAEAYSYDTCMKSMLSSGNFSQKALDRLAKSWVELGILTAAVNPNMLISTQFVKVVA